MEGVTGTMAWLSHVPDCSRAGLYGPANIDFRIPDLAEMEAACEPAQNEKRVELPYLCE